MRNPEIDHVGYPKRCRFKSKMELLYTIDDCRKAIAAMPTNPKVGYYTDEIHYCAMELRRREEAGR